MSKKSQTANTTQEKPTRPQPMDRNGRRLDGHGLPLSGPARKVALAKLGKPDPRDNPDAWAPPASPDQGA